MRCLGCCAVWKKRTGASPSSIHHWAALWPRRGLPGALPDQAQALEPLTSQGLIAIVNDADGDLTGFRIHPGVAAAGRAKASQEFQGALNLEDRGVLEHRHTQACVKKPGAGPLLMSWSGRAAVPYLLRLGEHELALVLLEQVLHRDRSPGTVLALLPVLRQIADGAHGSDGEIGAALLEPGHCKISTAIGQYGGSGFAHKREYQCRDRSASVILNDLINNYLQA